MTASATPAPLAQAQAMPAERTMLARRALLGALALGVLADPLLRNGPWGLGLLLWMAAFAGFAAVLMKTRPGTLSPEAIAWLAIALVFAAGPSWRDSDMLQFFDVVAMLTALVLVAMNVNARPVPRLGVARVRDLIRTAAGTGFEVATGAIFMVLRDADLQRTLGTSTDGNFRRISRAVLITSPILVVFVLLFTRADPVFESYVRLPEFRLDELVSHIVVAGFFAWVVAGWIRRALLPHTDVASFDDPAFRFTLGATDVAIAFGALLVLFTTFVVVQMGWLFGGESLVLRTTGLSYAEYARRGFFELTCVAGLLLTVLLGAQGLIPEFDIRAHRLYRRLAFPLVLLLGAIMVSAGARMNLYIQYYGISVDRLYASAFMIWLGVVFAWLVLTVLRSRPRSFATGMVLSGFAVLFALNVLNPDAFVARANLARNDVSVAGARGADLPYIATLGGDAVPMVVASLTASGTGADSAAHADRCRAANTLLDRWTNERRVRASANWAQWNAARARAASAVRAHESELRLLACPEPAKEHR